MAALASRYARALVDVVLEHHIDGDAARQQLRAFVGTVHESLELRRVWESPAVLPEKKRAVLDAITAKIGAAQPIRNFMAVVIDHRRIGMLDDIVRVFERELDAELGFAEVEVSSARPLSPEQRRSVETRVQQMTGKQIRASYVSNPELLGGIVVRVGDTIYDGSVRGQLETMRQKLSMA